MTKHVQFKLPDEVYAQLEDQAAAVGMSPNLWAQAMVLKAIEADADSPVSLKAVTDEVSTVQDCVTGPSGGWGAAAEVFTQWAMERMGPVFRGDTSSDETTVRELSEARWGNHPTYTWMKREANERRQRKERAVWLDGGYGDGRR